MRLHLIDVTGFALPDGSTSVHWFRDAFAALGLEDSFDLVVHDGIAGALPDPGEAARPGAGVIVSGSRGPVDPEKPWVPPLLELIADLHERGADLLGICFGCQALAIVLGGAVGENPRGREMGTELVTLTPEGERDPIFENLPTQMKANLVHRMHVTALPPGATRLAFNQMTPVQAFRLGRSVGLQPHPDMTPRQLNGLVDLYGRILVRNEGFLDDNEHLALFRRSFRETPEFRRTLLNFAGSIRQ